MKVVKKTDEYTIFEKRNKRHAVQGKDKKWINGEDKVRILNEAGLIKIAAPAPKVEEAPVEAEAAPEAAEAAEAAADEAPAEEAAAEAPAEEAAAEEEKKED